MDEDGRGCSYLHYTGFPGKTSLENKVSVAKSWKPLDHMVTQIPSSYYILLFNENNEACIKKRMILGFTGRKARKST